MARVDDNTAYPPRAIADMQFLLGVMEDGSTGKVETSSINDAIEAKADASALAAHTSDTSNPHSVTAAQVGLGNVDNTSDAAKPVSTAQAAADAAIQADLDAHEADTTAVHGIADTSALLDSGDIGSTVQAWDTDLDTIASLGVVSTPATSRLAIGGNEVGNSGWKTPTLLNGWTASSARYRRQTGFVVVEFGGLNGSAATSNLILTLPAGYRPSTAVPDSGTNGAGVNDTVFTIQVGSGGGVTANRSIVTNGQAQAIFATDEAWA